MERKKKIYVKISFALIALTAVLLIYPALCGNTHRGLHLITGKESASRRNGLVVVTHGWVEKGGDWPKDMAEAISERVDANQWGCGYFDWSKGAARINPVDAAKYARDKAGAELAKEILKLERNFEHIHLIGHSSGCWAVSEAAKILCRQSEADIHLTFFDAYVPKDFSADSLGDINAPPDVNFWADHYYTRDYTSEQTERDLPHAHNMDLTAIDQFIKDHNFPWKWYYATITGTFGKHSFMDDGKLATDVNGIEYGFARSREADQNAWQKSLTLETGNKAIKVEAHKEQ